jgi:hypothetical protein
MSRMRLPILLSLTASTAALATPELPPDANLFGDGIVRKINAGQVMPDGARMIPVDPAGLTPARPDGGSHLLVFHDGWQLRGEIVTLTQDEVAWQRTGVSEPLRFSRADVRSIVLSPPVEVTDDAPQNHPLEPAGGLRQAKSEASAAATIKLGGGDWLFGDVASADGQTFAIQLGAGTSFTIPRMQIEWLYGGVQPAPAFALSAGGLGLTGWRSAGAAARVEATGTTMTVRDASWFGRSAELPARFEVSFEIPAESEDGTRLWLQPYGQQPNSYTLGTINLRLGPAQMTRQIFLNGFVQKAVKILQKAPNTPPSYRVLYDAEEARLVVLRNGERLGDWRFSDERQNLQVNGKRTYAITGILFDRENPQHGRDLKFNRLEVRPWNGLVPKADEPPAQGDVLSLGKEPPRAGNLESFSEKYFALSGTTLMREPGMFVQFPQRPGALANATGTLDFGAQGELSVADLEIRDGQARCRTAFTAALTMPVTTLKTIVFPARAASSPANDVLVFKNGDEVPGALLSATPDGPLRWRMIRGQEVEIQVAQVAGVVFAAGRKASPAQDRATIELRNGDRLRGEFDGLDGTYLQLRHTQLGAVAIERSRVWRLFPNPQFAVYDGACDLDTWLGKDQTLANASPGEDEEQPTAVPWLCLDGRYVLRARGTPGAGWVTSRLQSVAGRTFERFEVRFDITSAGENQPSFNLEFRDKSGGSSVQTSLSDGEFRIFAVNPNAKNGMGQQEVALSDKLVDPTTRLSVRAFVDRKAGAIDFLFDGVPVAKIGHRKGERMPEVGAQILLQSQTSDESAVVVSNLWLGPWNGELPKPGSDTGPVIALANGDLAAGTPTAWRDGKFSFDSDIGPLELPLATVQSIEFGGGFAPDSPVARVRLPHGGSLNVDTFRWDGRELTAHSATAGDLHLPADAVCELIFNPPSTQAQHTPPSRKLAQKTETPTE